MQQGSNVVFFRTSTCMPGLCWATEDTSDHRICYTEVPEASQQTLQPWPCRAFHVPKPGVWGSWLRPSPLFSWRLQKQKEKKNTLDKAKKFGVFVYQSECISVQCNFLLQWNSRNKGGNDNNTSLCSCPSAACFFITFRQTLMPVKGKVFTQANKMQKKRSVFWHTNPVYSLCCLSSDSMSVWVQCQCQPDREWERGRDRQRPRNLALQHLHTLLTLHKREGTVP